MKRRAYLKRKTQYGIVLIFISLCIIYCLFSVQTCYAFAQTVDQSLNESVLEQIESLDLESLQAYVDSLGVFTEENVAERLYRYIKGEEIDYANLGNELLAVLFAKVSDVLPAFACIMAITLLAGLISTMKSGTNVRTTSGMIFLMTYVAALIPLIAVLTECIQEAKNGVMAMQQQMQIVLPILLTLMAASGGTLTVSVCRPAVGFFATNIVSVIHSVVFPITLTIIVFSMIANLGNDLKISKFTAFFKGINKWIIGVCISVFGIFFTLQGITAANYDGIVRRAAKYAIGNGIPIVGGFLSGGFDLAVAGSVLIKNSLGNMSIFLMLAVIFEPLTLLIAVNVLLRLTAAITQPFGEGKISDFLGETAENLNYCTAGLLFTAFLYFLTIMLMIYSSEALF